MVSYFLWERDAGGWVQRHFYIENLIRHKQVQHKTWKVQIKREKKQKRKCSVKKKFDELSADRAGTGWGGGLGLAGVRVWWPLPRCDPVDRMWRFGLQTSRGRSFLSEGFIDQSDCVFGDKMLKPAAEDEVILSSVSLKGPGTELLRYSRYQLADENQSRSFVSAVSWPEHLEDQMMERILDRMACGAEGSLTPWAPSDRPHGRRRSGNLWLP